MDPAGLGLTDTGVVVTVDLAGDPTMARVARRRRPCAALPARHRRRGNSADAVAVTDRLGGDCITACVRRSSSASAASGRCERSASPPTCST